MNHSDSASCNNDSARGECPLCGSPNGPTLPLSAERLRMLLGDGLAERLGLYPMPPDFRLSVVIPVFNERNTLDEILRRVRAVPIAKEIILVDDGSTDGTRDLLSAIDGQEGLKIYLHERNRGKGAAIRTGFAHASGNVVLVQDADLEYDPVHYLDLIKPIVQDVADVVYGSRFQATGPHRVLYFWHYVANRVLTTLSNMFTDLNLTDVETCYKVFRREVVESLTPTLKEDRFGIEMELTAKVARRKFRIYEQGITYFGRTYSEGKKIGLRDAFRALWCVVRYWKMD